MVCISRDVEILLVWEWSGALVSHFPVRAVGQ